jgi:coenzyme F420-reducing hydrogenase alpha subunit
MSAVQAIENIFQIKQSAWMREMRRLFYCGEWIESHCLHIHFLAIPDFLGYVSAIEVAKDHPEIIRRGMRLQKLGNQIIQLLGGRSVHPVGACVGGFYHAPTLSAVNNLLKQLEEGIADAEDLIRWTASIDFPDVTQDFICVALSNDSEYAMNEGRIISDDGLNIDADEFATYFQEQQVSYSNALHCTLRGKSYLLGSLSRVNLNYDHLPKTIKKIIAETPISFPSKNMFYSMTARAVEICFALYEAHRILKNYQLPQESRIATIPKAGVGFGCTEAPRGMLWHQYELDENGMVRYCRIVPPTSQNQGRIEEDLRYSLEKYGLMQNEKTLRTYCEKIIRNYYPCISCATHFLNLSIEHR